LWEGGGEEQEMLRKAREKEAKDKVSLVEDNKN